MHRDTGIEVSRVWVKGQTLMSLPLLLFRSKDLSKNSLAIVGPSWCWNGEAGSPLYGSGEADPTVWGWRTVSECEIPHTGVF